MTLNGDNHMDTCASRYCRTLDYRRNMGRIDGKRGYFCQKCLEKLRKSLVRSPK